MPYRDFGIIKWFETEAQMKEYAEKHPKKLFIYITKR